MRSLFPKKGKQTFLGLVFIFTLIWAFLSILLPACRKLDMSSDNNLENIDRFFNPAGQKDNIVLSVMAGLKTRDLSKPFAEKMISRIGMPRWDKTIVSRRFSKVAEKTMSSTDTMYLYTPFVSDAYYNVQAVFITRIADKDTSFKLLRADDYKDYPDVSSGATATDVALLFLNFEYSLYGHSRMEIKDYKRLFFHSYQDSTLLYTNGISMESRTCSSTSNVYFSVCTEVIEVDDFNQEQYDTDILPHDGVDNNEHSTCKTYCLTQTDYYECGGGGGSSNGGGWDGSAIGGGDGVLPPGGLSGPSDPHPFTYDPDDLIKNHTAQGPVATLEGWAPPALPVLTSEPIDSVLLKTSVAANVVADSMMHLSELVNRAELVTTIVQRADGTIYTRNMRTDYSQRYSIPDFTVDPGEIVIGTIHIHNTAQVSNRSAPSGGDLNGLKLRMYQNFVLYAECGNVRFALVIEDVNKAKALLKNYSAEMLTQQLNDNAHLVTNWVNDWQNATKVALTNLLGSAATSGIGFYVSNNTGKTTYTKLNP